MCQVSVWYLQSNARNVVLLKGARDGDGRTPSSTVRDHEEEKPRRARLI